MQFMTFIYLIRKFNSQEMSYDEIKDRLQKENFSKIKLKTKIFLWTLGGIIFSEASIVFISMIPFIIVLYLFDFEKGLALFYVVVHFLFYKFYLKKAYQKEFQSSIEEIELTIKALKEIKSEK